MLAGRRRSTASAVVGLAVVHHYVDLHLIGAGSGGRGPHHDTGQPGLLGGVHLIFRRVGVRRLESADLLRTIPDRKEALHALHHVLDDRAKPRNAVGGKDGTLRASLLRLEHEHVKVERAPHGARRRPAGARHGEQEQQGAWRHGANYAGPGGRAACEAAACGQRGGCVDTAPVAFLLRI